MDALEDGSAAGAGGASGGASGGVRVDPGELDAAMRALRAWAERVRAVARSLDSPPDPHGGEAGSPGTALRLCAEAAAEAARGQAGVLDGTASAAGTVASRLVQADQEAALGFAAFDADRPAIRDGLC